jgi:hypothetical protein
MVKNANRRAQPRARFPNSRLSFPKAGSFAFAMRLLPFAMSFSVALGVHSLEAAAFSTFAPMRCQFLKRSVCISISATTTRSQGVPHHHGHLSARPNRRIVQDSGVLKHAISEFREQMDPCPLSSWPVITGRQTPQSHLGHAKTVRTFPPCNTAVRSLRGGTDASPSSFWARALDKGKGCLWRKQPPAMPGQIIWR